MSYINICRDNKDPFYRYKMPPIVSKIEGRGNGIKTAVVNASDVARALSRPPSYVIKYFGIELGAQSNMDEANDRYLVNGAHDSHKLQDLLDGFINKFVLCGSCKNPETDIILLKGGLLTRDCKACGQRTKIDPVHRLSTYILKNPPSSAKGRKTAGASANTSNAIDESKQEDEATGHSDDDELTRRIHAEAKNIKGIKGNEDDENWATDVSEEAVRARQAQLEKTMAVLSVEDDDHGDSAAYSELGEWVSKEKPSDVEIYKKAHELGISGKHKTVQVLAQTLFTEDIVEEIEDHSGLLSKMIGGSKSHEKALLGGIERLIGLTYPEKIPAVPKILFKLYDEDLISEETVTNWGTKVSKKYVDKETSKKVRKAAKPFLEWLEQASSSEDESDDE